MTQLRIIKSLVPPMSQALPLDSYLARRFTYLSYARWREEIAGGKLSLGGIVVTDPALLLQGGEVMVWDGSGIVEPEVDIGIKILYEDEWFIAVNKTGNLPIHPAGRYFNNTLVSMLTDLYGRKLYPVHRLDRETSGVLLLAFDGKNVRELAQALATGSKEYLALVHGNLPDGELIADWPLGRDEQSVVSKKRRAWPGGAEKALTRFQKIMNVGNVSLIRCFPKTGRLHQIRAHLLAAGYPLVGDKLYGRDETAFLEFIRQGLTPELEKSLVLPRQALHAARLTFTHPQISKEMIIRASLPPMFADFIRAQKARV